MGQAACQEVARNYERNPAGKVIDPFFPEAGEDKSAGSMMCFECPVRKKCDQYADDIGAKSGTWGGKNRR